MKSQIELSPEAKKNLRRIKDRRLHDRLIAAIADLYRPSENLLMLQRRR
jgi:hypothetical protein